jgi:hypothetical protein
VRKSATRFDQALRRGTSPLALRSMPDGGG